MGLAENPATPYVAMVLASTSQVGLIIISKRSVATGMSNYGFVALSNALAALVLLPLSLLVHRSSTRPPLTFVLVCGFFCLGVLGCLGQVAAYTGVKYISAEYASALLNLIPGFTFILALMLRMERIACKSSSFWAKAMGTVVSIAGAFVETLYKGPEILTLHSSSTLHYEYLHIQQWSWIIGGLLTAAYCACTSGFIILQAVILPYYPAELIIVFFYCFFTAILSAIISLIVDGGRGDWALQPSIRLFGVLYAGIFGAVFQVSIGIWCLHRRGPLFVSMFQPLGIVISAVLGVLFLGDILYLGNLVGSVIIVVGFYSVMWGKAKEVNVIEDSVDGIPESTGENAPLLPSKDEQMKV